MLVFGFEYCHLKGIGPFLSVALLRCPNFSCQKENTPNIFTEEKAGAARWGRAGPGALSHGTGRLPVEAAPGPSGARPATARPSAAAGRALRGTTATALSARAAAP